jgi:hypothetical protein
MSFQPKQNNKDHSLSQEEQTTEAHAEFGEAASTTQLENILGRINAIMTDGSPEELLAKQKADDNSLQTGQSPLTNQVPLTSQAQTLQTNSFQNDQPHSQLQHGQKVSVDNSARDMQQSLDERFSQPLNETGAQRGDEFQAAEPLDMLQPYSEVLNEVRDYFNDKHSLDPNDSLANSQNPQSITEEVLTGSSLRDEVNKPKKILLWGDAPLDSQQSEDAQLDSVRPPLSNMSDKKEDRNGATSVSNLSPADFGFGQSQQENISSHADGHSQGGAQNELAQREERNVLGEPSQIFSPIKFENPFARNHSSMDVVEADDHSGHFKQLRHELVDRISQLEQVIGHHFGDRKEIANEAARAAMKLAINNLDDTALGRRLADVETAFILYQKNQTQKNQETQETIEKLGKALLKMESVSQVAVDPRDAKKLEIKKNVPSPLQNSIPVSSVEENKKPSETAGDNVSRSREYRVDEIQIPTETKEKNSGLNDKADLSSRITDMQSSVDDTPPLLSPEALDNFDKDAGMVASEAGDVNAIAKLRQAMSKSASERTFGKPENETGGDPMSARMSASPSNEKADEPLSGIQGKELGGDPGSIRGDDFLSKSATLRDQFNSADIVSNDSDLHTMQPRGLRVVVLIVVIALLLAATGIAFRGNTKGFQDAIFNIVATAKGVLGQGGSLEKTAKTLPQVDKKSKEQNEQKEKVFEQSKSDDRLGSLIKNYKASSPLLDKEPVITGNIGENSNKLDQSLDQSVLESGGVKLGMPPALIGPYSLRLAAARGDVRAEYEVARRFSYGLGVPKDAEKAVKWYMQGASKGFAPAQYRLATYYERGRGVEKNLGRAKVWYQRAAMLGNIKAMHNLAVISTALDKEDTNYKAAIYWFKQAANRNLADSQFNLAILYQNGVGLSKDNIEAYKWFSLAARQGDVDAASRRDTLEKKLKKEDLLKASQILQGWRALTIDPKANDVGRISSHITSTMSHAHETVSRSRILTAQILLRKLGYGLKAADGSMNEETIRAVKKFEKDKGMPITGKINPDLIQKLNKASL